jgi:hypothetical protein
MTLLLQVGLAATAAHEQTLCSFATGPRIDDVMKVSTSMLAEKHDTQPGGRPNIAPIGHG